MRLEDKQALEKVERLLAEMAAPRARGSIEIRIVDGKPKLIRIIRDEDLCMSG